MQEYEYQISMRDSVIAAERQKVDGLWTILSHAAASEADIRRIAVEHSIPLTLSEQHGVPLLEHSTSALPHASPVAAGSAAGGHADAQPAQAQAQSRSQGATGSDGGAPRQAQSSRGQSSASARHKSERQQSGRSAGSSAAHGATSLTGQAAQPPLPDAPTRGEPHHPWHAGNQHTKSSDRSQHSRAGHVAVGGARQHGRLHGSAATSSTRRTAEQQADSTASGTALSYAQAVSRPTHAHSGASAMPQAAAGYPASHAMGAYGVASTRTLSLARLAAQRNVSGRQSRDLDAQLQAAEQPRRQRSLSTTDAGRPTREARQARQRGQLSSLPEGSAVACEERAGSGAAQAKGLWRQLVGGHENTMPAQLEVSITTGDSCLVIHHA